MKKELIGWTIAKQHYRLNNRFVVLAVFFIDFIGKLLFFYKKKKVFDKKPKKILVVTLNHIGDMILASAFINNLKINYPKSQVSVLCRSSVKPIAQLIPKVDKIITLNTPWFARGDSQGWIKTIKFALKNRKKYDLSYDLHSDPRNIILSSILSKYSVGYGIRGLGFLLNKKVTWNPLSKKHIVERQLDLVKYSGLKIKSNKLSLKTPSMKKVIELLKKRGIKKTDKIALVQFSSGAKAKDYPLEFWQEIIKELIKKKYKVVTADLNQKLIAKLQKQVKLTSIHTTLTDYAALVSLSSLVLSVDTFTVHFAAAYSKKVIGLYAGTNLVYEWAPYTNKKIVFQEKKCKIYPCGLQNCKYSHPSDCTKKISAKSLLKNI
ncbi:glycosyltransferase family 9 protein [Candidatus Woesearchaeota archaeon]|nr:glycosyltransferase family 9 protein [Candidatus Woesearchaeota archaeon]